MIVSLIAAMSVDGYIAQSAEQKSLDWTSKEDLKFFVEKTKEIGTLVMGRTTFDTIGKPLKGRRVIVMTRAEAHLQPTLEDGETKLEYTTEGPEALVHRLTAEGVEKIVVCGGATIYSQFLQAGLVNELFLTVEPVLFGEGVSFAKTCGRIPLSLVETRPIGPATLFHYKTI